MKLIANFIGLQTGRNIAILNQKDAEELGVSEGGRIRIEAKNKSIVAIVNISRTLKKGKVILSDEIKKLAKIKSNEEVDVELALQPEAVKAIRAKLDENSNISSCLQSDKISY
jgi:predicted molibdopterin-dependent oxidoreductase YjgC